MIPKSTSRDEQAPKDFRRTLPLYVSVGALILSAVTCLAAITGFLTPSPKVGFVRTGEVISKSAAFKKARAQYEQQIQTWQMNLDTLQQEYVRNLSAYNSKSFAIPAEERSRLEMRLTEQRATIERYSSAISERSQVEERRLSDSLLKQINMAVEQYGRERGFDVILGTTSEGSLLYGSEATDVTSSVLEYMNR